ncbi:hypothetical protein [Thalassospira alkalitolerans]|uniref:Uncharacterized protein n=1 Tax=Thalassospira alkalitolerans TaxID=1293890 RepID=A0A1Y2L8V4_9PROT|nr:hypothetical protein [Thalassospira alkalitolerans]OSQ46885.1 hypothetical protein TALK_15025 [Thalassospira alkalitolerans]|tara:strand:+ start:90542 stop:90793 length:252 start_codon:yes stop_codon:yes gene_type:complete
MSAQITTHSLVATTNAAPTSKSAFGAVVWRWLVLSAQHVAKRHKIARDTAWLRESPEFVLRDVGLDRNMVERACLTGKASSND